MRQLDALLVALLSEKEVEKAEIIFDFVISIASAMLSSISSTSWTSSAET